jgi:hypothetical protein
MNGKTLEYCVSSLLFAWETHIASPKKRRIMGIQYQGESNSAFNPGTVAVVLTGSIA